MIFIETQTTTTTAMGTMMLMMPVLPRVSDDYEDEDIGIPLPVTAVGKGVTLQFSNISAVKCCENVMWE